MEGSFEKVNKIKILNLKKKKIETNSYGVTFYNYKIAKAFSYCKKCQLD